MVGPTDPPTLQPSTLHLVTATTTARILCAFTPTQVWTLQHHHTLQRPKALHSPPRPSRPPRSPRPPHPPRHLRPLRPPHPTHALALSSPTALSTPSAPSAPSVPSAPSDNRVDQATALCRRTSRRVHPPALEGWLSYTLYEDSGRLSADGGRVPGPSGPPLGASPSPLWSPKSPCMTLHPPDQAYLMSCRREILENPCTS